MTKRGEDSNGHCHTIIHHHFPHCQQLADSPAPSPGPSSTVREWSLGHFPPPGKPKRWGRPIGITGLRPRCPHCVHHAAAYWREGFAQAVAGRRLILRAIRRYALSAAQLHLPVGLGSVRRRWEAVPLTREGS